MKKSFNAKKLLALLLALMMVFSAVPLVFAAPTGPVAQSAGSLKNGADGGHYVSFRINLQNFTFVQEHDNQEFQFTMRLGVRKNASINYGWVYAGWERNQTITSPIGKNHSVTWSGYQEGLETGWKDVDVTIKFTGEGARDYATNLKVIYDAGATSFSDRWEAGYDIPLTVKVLDKRALNQAIADAMAKNNDRYNYTSDTWDTLVKYLLEAQDIDGNVVVEQNVIDRTTKNLRDAIDALTFKPADYSALENAKAAAKPIIDTPNAEEIYTADTIRNLAEKYNAALAVNSGLDIRHQGEITKAANDLQAAVDGLVKFADYKALQTAVNNYNKLNPKYFAPEKFEAVKALADKAKEDLKPENKLDETHQGKIDAQAAELEQAIAALEILPADYDVFNRAVANAKAKLESAEIANYTPDSVRNLEDAYIASAKVLKNQDITYQPTVDAAAKRITDAMAGLALKNADYSKLDVAIVRAEAELRRSDLSDYTAESIDKLTNALAAARNVNRNLTIDKQSVIDESTATLLTALSLNLKGADYTGLDAAIAARTQELQAAKASGKYTGGSMTRLQMAIDVASQTDRTYTIKEQNLVDDAIAALNSVTLEKKAADTKNLQAAIDLAQKTLNEAGDEYTEESKLALQAAIKEAREVLAANGSDIDNQEVIDAQIVKLQAVKLQLKGADYRELDAAIAQAEAFLADPKNAELYTPEAIEKVRDALNKANQVDRDLTIKEQATVDAAIVALEAAKPNDSSYKPAELATLTDSIARANALLAKDDIADYTEASVNALREAVNAAQALADSKPNVTQQDAVNAQAQALDAMELKLKSADYAALETAVAQATLKLDEARKSGLYTEESLKVLEDAIIQASALLENKDLTIKEQKVVDDAVASLNVEFGYKAADLTALNAEILKAEGVIAAPLYTNYTEQSRVAYEAILAEAKAMRDSNPDITKQDEVAALAQRLADAKLVLKEANYAELDTKISEVESMLETNLSDNFTKESIETLKAALRDAKNVDRNLDISQQEVIDSALAELVNAAAALAPYGKITQVQITHNDKVVEGDVTFEKVKWYKKYKSHSTVLGYEANGDVVDVKWELANWSIDKPEATIVDNGDGTITVTPNGKGIGARSVWVKVTVTDVNGNTAVDYVKVRFHKWNWQTKNY